MRAHSAKSKTILFGPSVIKRNLRRLFLLSILRLAIEIAILAVHLLLDRRSKFQKIFRHFLASLLQHIDESSCERFILLREHRNRQALFTRAACSSNAMDVILRRERERYVDD